MTQAGDEERWQLPDDTPAPPGSTPAAGAPARPAGPGRVVCWIAVGLAVLGLPTLATVFVTLPHELAVLPALGFGLGWLGVWAIDRVDGTGRNIGLVAVRISAVCLVVFLASPIFEFLLL
jgi:hypothetical protein